MEFLLAVLLSFIPAFFYAYIIYWFDRYEKEPLLMLVGVFIWGAVVATIGAVIASVIVEFGIFLITQSEVITDLSGGSIVAPIVEESLKGFAVLIVFLLFRKEFDSYLDGIVYASVTALGFAATENVLYLYFGGFADGGLPGLFALFFLRVILGGWNHPVYTAFIGIGLAMTRLTRKTSIKIIAPIVGWFIGVTIHGLHNTMAVVLGMYLGLGGLVATIIVDWISWLIMLGIIIWAIFREKQWIKTYLQEEVEAGIISQDQFKKACSSWAQTATRMRAMFSKHYKPTRRFYQVCSELSQKKHQFHIFGEEKNNSAIIEKLRAELTQLAPNAK